MATFKPLPEGTSVEQYVHLMVPGARPGTMRQAKSGAMVAMRGDGSQVIVSRRVYEQNRDRAPLREAQLSRQWKGEGVVNRSGRGGRVLYRNGSFDKPVSIPSLRSELEHLKPELPRYGAHKQSALIDFEVLDSKGETRHVKIPGGFVEVDSFLNRLRGYTSLPAFLNDWILESGQVSSAGIVAVGEIQIMLVLGADMKEAA